MKGRPGRCNFLSRRSAYSARFNLETTLEVLGRCNSIVSRSIGEAESSAELMYRSGKGACVCACVCARSTVLLWGQVTSRPRRSLPAAVFSRKHFLGEMNRSPRSTFPEAPWKRRSIVTGGAAIRVTWHEIIVGRLVGFKNCET